MVPVENMPDAQAPQTRSVEAVADRLAELRASGQARAAAESMEAKETRVAAEAQAASARAASCPVT